MERIYILKKVVMVVGTDVYILSVLGPYLADGKNNDASILKDMLETNIEELRSVILLLPLFTKRE
jgi:hypothetical protein